MTTCLRKSELEQCLQASRAGFLWFLNTHATTVKSTVSWITVVRGVVDAVFILRLTGESRNTTTESNSTDMKQSARN